MRGQADELKPSTTRSGIAETSDGKRVIPSSMRADGSTRKEIKIRPGYRPPEDVEVYKNRAAAAWKQRGSDWRGGVPGACPVSDEEDDGVGSGAGGGEGEAISKNAKKRAAKKRTREREREKEKEEEGKEEGKEAGKEAGKEEGREEGQQGAGDGNSAPSAASFTSAKTKTTIEGMTDEEKTKQAKAIKKKIRQANDLKLKKDSGESLLPEQLEKVLKIVELTRQLEALGVNE